MEPQVRASGASRSVASDRVIAEACLSDDVAITPSAVAHTLPSFAMRSMLEMAQSPLGASAAALAHRQGFGVDDGLDHRMCRRLTREDMQRQLAGFLFASDSDSEPERATS